MNLARLVRAMSQVGVLTKTVWRSVIHVVKLNFPTVLSQDSKLAFSVTKL